MQRVKGFPHQSGKGVPVLQETRKILDRLEMSPLLMKQHKGLPSIVSILTGEDLDHSWWSHPQSRLLFRVMSELADHPDVLVCKLLFRKDTFVHRRLFPALLCAAQAEGGSPLGSAARELLKRIEASKNALAGSGSAAKELVLKVKVHALELHTDSGKHELKLESWRLWAKRAAVIPMPSSAAAVMALQQAAEALGAKSAALPFQLEKS
jgi:hypothetical protein